MSLERRELTIYFACRRVHHRAATAEFRSRVDGRREAAPSQPGSLEFFLIDRHCLYSARGDRSTGTILHEP